VNKYFFPLLLKKKGRVVNISSEVALSWLSAGFNAPYSMSKFAIEAYSTALRQELGLLGMPVVVVNPGAMRTPLLTDQVATIADSSIVEQTVAALALVA
jgi:NAD(P)-dependent dehydrogenase (short-subunit alcohol dehydrogenase family)